MIDIEQKALEMLQKYPLCDHCLGRQFALLGYGMGNEERGRSIKLVIAFKAHAEADSKNKHSIQTLRILAANGFLNSARELLQKLSIKMPSEAFPNECSLCQNKLESVDAVADKAATLVRNYEHRNFLVGTELPVDIEEREDNFKAAFDVGYGEDMRNEFGRLIGKRVAEATGKEVEFQKPEIVILANPFTGNVELQVNPLFIAGRYRKLVRGIPQSKWFCSSCHGKGCKKCSWTGKMYPESVEEIIAGPILEATGGTESSFHAAGREDIDARMLGTGRPFVIEIAKPKSRFLDLKKIEGFINAKSQRKVRVSGLTLADRNQVRKLKKGEGTQKEYRVVVEFEREATLKDLRLLKKRLVGALVSQRTPLRVMHRRADLTREKYIYDVNVNRLTPKRAQMKIRCQGGLYVKELVTGDDGRTVPSVSEILNTPAKPLKLDVLNVIME